MPVTALMMQAVRNGGAVTSTPTPSPTPTTQIGFAFRATVGFVTDVAPDVFVDSTAVYSAPQGWGYVSFSDVPTEADDTNTYPARIAGAHQWTGGPGANQLFQVDLVNGNYKLRLGMGFTFSPFRQNIQIWDGYLGVGSHSDKCDEWITSDVIPNTTYFRVYGNNLYQAATTGTTGATPPTHTTGTVSDGAVSWTYIKSSIYSLDVTPSDNIVDAAGNSLSVAAWAGSNVLSAAFAVTQGFVSITKKVGANYGRVRYIGLVGQ